MLHERAVTLVSLAYQTLGDILRDTEAPASVQFKAARFIVERGTAPTPETAQLAAETHKNAQNQRSPRPKTRPARDLSLRQRQDIQDCCRNNPLPAQPDK